MTYSDTLERIKALSQTPKRATDKTDKRGRAATRTPKKGTDKTDKRGSVSIVRAVLRRLETCNPGSAADRRQCADDVVRAVQAEVHRIAPVGLGRWPDAWEIVEESSRVFLDTLAAWEHADPPTELDRAALVHATQQTLRAWEHAAQSYPQAHTDGWREGQE